jgi:hypothetical protein
MTTLANAAKEARRTAAALCALDYDDIDDTEEIALSPEQRAELLKRAKARSGPHKLNLPPRRESTP